MTRYVWRRLRHLVIYRILHVDDTPHRIALGVAVGLFVACSPLIGLHMLVALLLCMLVQANRAVSILVVWVSNPATFLPIISFNWVVGRTILPGSALRDAAEVRHLFRQLLGTAEGITGFVGHVFSVEFWAALFHLFWQLGVELWIGSILVGGVAAVIGYFVTRRAVIWRRILRRLHRQRCAQREEAKYRAAAASDDGQPVEQIEAEAGTEKAVSPQPSRLAEVAPSS